MRKPGATATGWPPGWSPFRIIVHNSRKVRTRVYEAGRKYHYEETLRPEIGFRRATWSFGDYAISIQRRAVYISETFDTSETELQIVVRVSPNGVDLTPPGSSFPRISKNHGWVSLIFTVSLGRFGISISHHGGWLCDCDLPHIPEVTTIGMEAGACVLAGDVPDDLAFAEMLEMNRRRRDALLNLYKREGRISAEVK